MDDDNRPIPPIRPAIPVRAAITESIMKDAGAVAGMRQPQDPGAFPEPDVPLPNRRAPVKDTKRSAAAREVWKRRRADPAPRPHGGKFAPEVYQLIGALMELDKPTRAKILTVIEALDK